VPLDGIETNSPNRHTQTREEDIEMCDADEGEERDDTPFLYDVTLTVHVYATRLLFELLADDALIVCMLGAQRT
jgi:hypothetical protein